MQDTPLGADRPCEVSWTDCRGERHVVVRATVPPHEDPDPVAADAR